MCSILNVSKSGYYKYLQSDFHIAHNDLQCLSKVKQYKETQPYVGTVKLWKMLENDGLKIGRNHLNDLLKGQNMLIKKKKKYCRTSISDGSKVYPNLVKNTQVNRKNQVWVTDITYISKDKGFYYLFLLSDMYTRQILDYEVSPNMLTINHINMLKRQLKNVDHTNDLIHHSDHGSQYTSNETIKLLKKHGVKISMTGEGKCYDNPIAERINCTMKHEFGLKRTFSTIKRLKKATNSAVIIYNSVRLHKSLGYSTPNDFAHHHKGIPGNEQLLS
jgi:transposase InsO family protein